MSRRSLSLVEVAVAVVLLLLLMAGLFSSLGATQRAQAETREREAASRALFAALNDLELVPFEALQVGPNLPTYAFPVMYSTGSSRLVQLLPASPATQPLNADVAGTSADESRYAGHVTVIRDPNADGSDALLDLRLTVAWRGLDGRDQVLSICSRRVRP